LNLLYINPVFSFQEVLEMHMYKTPQEPEIVSIDDYIYILTINIGRNYKYRLWI